MGLLSVFPSSLRVLNALLQLLVQPQTSGRRNCCSHAAHPIPNPTPAWHQTKGHILSGSHLFFHSTNHPHTDSALLSKDSPRKSLSLNCKSVYHRIHTISLPRASPFHRPRTHHSHDGETAASPLLLGAVQYTGEPQIQRPDAYRSPCSPATAGGCNALDSGTPQGFGPWSTDLNAPKSTKRCRETCEMDRVETSSRNHRDSLTPAGMW